jgi:hypothetical protein
VVIADSKLGGNENVPAGSQFVRWVGKDQILLKTAQGLVRHSISGAPDFTFPIPEGWSAAASSGNVITGTDSQFWRGPDGKLVVKVGSEPFREVLEGTKATRFTAVANDLSAFGGVDDEKRLWVQRGFNAKPGIVAQDVERVIWGPLARRAVVQDAKNNTRVYDSRDGTWIDLGVVSGSTWSPDEERLLYVETSGASLSLLTNRRVERICTLSRLGALAGAAITADGERVFLLAGLEGALDIWELALPAKTQN